MSLWTVEVRKVVKSIFTSPVKTFLVLGSVFGLLMILAAPPFTGADEEAHFVRAYGITGGALVLNGAADVEMPTSYRKTLGCMQTRQPIAGVTYGYTYDEYANEKKQALKCAFTLPLDQGDTEMVHTTAPGYSPLTYIPQSLAIGIGRIFNMPIVAMMYLTRSHIWQ
jgi:hypothetical protein